MDKDIFNTVQDVLKHTYGLGSVSIVKLERDVVKCVSDDKSFVMRGKVNHELEGLLSQKVGLANMNILSGLLKFPPFSEDGASIKVGTVTNKAGDVLPKELQFKSPHGHESSYSFMSAATADKTVKVPKQVIVDGGITFTPTSKNLKDVVYFNGILSGIHDTFIIRLMGGKLEFIIGDDNTSSCNIPVAEDILGHLSGDMIFPLAPVISILKLADNSECEVTIHDKRMLTIVINSGIGTYTYTLQMRKRS